MQTFAQKPKAMQQTTSTKSTIADRGHFGQSPEVKSILHLQRTIGNQAVQRMLQTDAQEPEAELTGPASPRFGYDFSWIPTYPPASGAIQTKLAINEPGDKYEQEADSVAVQVMHMPEPQMRLAGACGRESPKWETENGSQGHQGLQTKHVESGTLGLTEAPPSVLDVVRSPGRTLDPAMRAFMEPRFGYDFSRIRVHSDAAAHQSARDINARAYTVGQNIVFGCGQLAPGTHKGQQLLAHELAHTLQQSGGAPARVALQPMDPRHARGLGGEQGMGFIHYRQEDGWIFFEGPSGSAGHGVTESGFDGVAYNVRTGEIHLVDNKSLARQGNVGSATAIDPSRNLGKNLDGLIQRVEAAKDVPGRVRLLGRLRALNTSLAAGKPLPQDVKLVVTGVGGQSTGVTGRLQSEGVEFRPEPPPKSQPAATPANAPTTPVEPSATTTTTLKPPAVPSPTAAPAPVAEGGVVGKIGVPQSGSVTLSGSSKSKGVTTTSGEIHHSGGGRIGGGAVLGGVLTGIAVLAEPLIKKWFAENYLQEKWSAANREMVENAITGSIWKYQMLIASRIGDIQKERAQGRQVKLRVIVETDWVATDFGPAQIKAEVVSYNLLFEGDTPIEWPLFQYKQSNLAVLFKAPQKTRRRGTYDFIL